MPMLLAALLLGVVAGLRSMTAPAALAWAIALGWLPVEGTWAALAARSFVRYLLTFFALGEIVGDKLPTTPSRKAPGPFVGRIASGALCGAVLGAPHGSSLLGGVAGAIGAVIGTLGGYEVRVRLARAFGRDLPAALLEDAVAIGGAWLIVSLAR